MDREFRAEMVKALSARLKRVYEADEQSLPAQIQNLIERLKNRERELAAERPSYLARCEEGP